MIKIISLVFTFSFLFACSPSSPPEQTVDASVKPVTIYTGGEIITMTGDEPNYVESLVESEGNIVFTGSLSDAKTQYNNGEMVNLNGQTLLPGFIDGHAHFANFSSQAIGAQILPPPDAGASSIDELLDILREWNTPENLALTGWIFGAGFDDSVLAEKRFPTKFDLDKVSTDQPIMIVHISAHFASLNSKGLELLGITADTPDPEGGIIRRVEGSLEPNGVLEELAAIPFYAKAMTPLTPESAKKFMTAGQNMALSYGYTTAQEGRAMGPQHGLLAQYAEEDFWKLDVVSYIDYIDTSPMESKWLSKDYYKNYRIGGLKVTLDGSPQGRTAWRTKPYLLPPEGAAEGYLGYPAFQNNQDVVDIYKLAYENDWQILTHANGDAAIDQMINSMREVAPSYESKDRRHVLIHGQYVRDDQLDAFVELDVITSLFPLHTFYWGDWHSQIIGPELGQRISPIRTALNKGLKVSIHTDAPVALPNLMRVVWIAVDRTSRSGEIIGEDERLTPYEALKAITEWSAYQHFEEDRKGTLEVGKLADMVVLDKNPLKVATQDIKDIQVMKTIKEGELVFVR